MNPVELRPRKPTRARRMSAPDAGLVIFAALGLLLGLVAALFNWLELAPPVSDRRPAVPARIGRAGRDDPQYN